LLESSAAPNVSRDRHDPPIARHEATEICLLPALAEQFSHSGVPVFMAEVKSDPSGRGAACSKLGNLQRCRDTLGIASRIGREIIRGRMGSIPSGRRR
jgi:hypothetical protein